ncbi:hypothetical protein FRB94_011594 [Tulasnella sp. JGI-2019a]|nr:hypothetical protein FRB94_011594 [Tulasnella sp. JGI-2019a]
MREDANIDDLTSTESAQTLILSPLSPSPSLSLHSSDGFCDQAFLAAQPLHAMPPRLSLPHLTNSKRPTSAIFIGSTTPPPTETDRAALQQLPSPPSSSQDSGSNGGREEEDMNASVHAPIGNYNGNGGGFSPNSDEDANDDNEEHTAKLNLNYVGNDMADEDDDRRASMDRASAMSSRAGYRDDEAVLERSANLAARNRQVLEHMKAITSGSTRNTPSPRPYNPRRSPIPRSRSTISPINGIRPPLSRKHSISGSETEREQLQVSGYDDLDDYNALSPPTSSGLPSGSNSQESQRQQQGNNFETTRASTNSRASLRRSPKHVATSVSNGTISRRRGGSVLDNLSSGDRSADAINTLFSGAINAAVNDVPTSTRTSPHQVRKPLPREFRDRSNIDVRRSDSRSSQSPTATRFRPPSRIEEDEDQYEHDRDYNTRRPVTSGGVLRRSDNSADLRSASRASQRLFSEELTASTSTVTASSSGSGLGVGRFNTVRERRTPSASSHSRWASEDMQSPRDEEDEANQNRSPGPAAKEGRRPWRYENRGGSAESALAGGRTLVGEGLRAAGLTRRRDEDRRDDDVFSSSRPGIGKGKERDGPETMVPSSSAVTHLSSASSAISESRSTTEMRRERLARLTNGNSKTPPGSTHGGSDHGDRDRYRDLRAPYSAGAASRGEMNRLPSSSSTRNLPTRPVTSMDAVYDSQPSRTAPPQLRSYRSGYIVPQRDPPAIPPVLPLLAPNMDRRAQTFDGHNSDSPLHPAYQAISPLPPPSRRTTPAPSHKHTYSASPAPAHATVLQDALSLFENNVHRNTSLHPAAASGCLTSADTLVQAAVILNVLLRANLETATIAHVDALVGEDGGGGGGDGESELWHSMSADLQKGVKLSDEIIRTMTAFLSDMGKAIKVSASNGAGGGGLTSSATVPDLMMSSPQTDSSSATETATATVVVNSHSRTMSLDEEALSMQREYSSHSRNGGRSMDGGSSSGSRSRIVRQSVDGTSPMNPGGRQTATDYSNNGLDSEPRDRHSGSLRRVVGRRSDVAEPGEDRRGDAGTSGSRSSAGGSANGRDRLEHERERQSPPVSKGSKAMSGAVTGVRKLFSARRPQTSPVDGRSDSFSRTRVMEDRRSPEDDYSPTPGARNGVANGRLSSAANNRRFPPLAIPPPLSTVPSTATVQKTSTVRFPGGSSGSHPNSTKSSRQKTSTGSTATLRGGGARFPSLTSPSKPTTHITTATVSTASDWDASAKPQMQDRQNTQTNFVSSPAAENYEGSERAQRQRTLSTRSTSDALPDARATSNHREDDQENRQNAGVSAGSSASSRRRPYSTLRDRSSLDGAPDRDRRRTVKEVFR